MKRLLVVLVVLAACGGSETPAQRLDASFGGVWTGNVEFVADNVTNFPGTLTISVDGTSMLVAGLCPDGSGSVFLSGHDTQGVSHDVAVCRPQPVGSCATTTVLYSLVTADLLQDGSVRTLAAGLASGCGATRNVSSFLTARRGS